MDLVILHKQHFFGSGRYNSYLVKCFNYKQTKTILLVSHDLSILNRLDQIMLLDRRIVAMGPPQQVATDENLRKTYGGRLALLDEAESALMRMR